MPTKFRLQFAGNRQLDFEFYDEAQDHFLSTYPNGTVGSDSPEDILFGGDVSYCWASVREAACGVDSAKATITRIPR